MRVAMAFILLLVVVLGSGGLSQAVLIDAGSVSLVSITDFSPAVYVLQGERFAVTGASFQVGLPPGPSFPQLSQVQVPRGATVDLSGTIPIHPYPPPSGPLPQSVPSPGPVVVFKGQSFIGATGALTFSTPSFDPLVDGTFTMTGQLTFGSQTIGVEGSGNAFFVETNFPVFGPDLIIARELRYEFSPVPEPATLTLLGTIGGLGTLLRWRKRRMARQHEGISSE
jgi:PEP-CTERM motif